MAVDDWLVLTKDDLVARKRLFASAATGNLAALERYIANNGNINSKDEYGLALIHYAACHGNVTLIRKLRVHGADMNLLDDGAPPWKPIHYAIFHRKDEDDEALKTLGAEVPLPILKRLSQERGASSSRTQNAGAGCMLTAPRGHA